MILKYSTPTVTATLQWIAQVAASLTSAAQSGDKALATPNALKHATAFVVAAALSSRAWYRGSFAPPLLLLGWKLHDFQHGVSLR